MIMRIAKTNGNVYWNYQWYKINLSSNLHAIENRKLKFFTQCVHKRIENIKNTKIYNCKNIPSY